MVVTSEDEMAQLIFPEEFSFEEHAPAKDEYGRVVKKKKGSGILDDWEEALFDDEEGDEMDDEEELFGAADGTPKKPDANKSMRFAQSQRKSKAGKTEKDRKSKKDETKEERKERKEAKKKRKLDKLDIAKGIDAEDDPATFEDLFGTAAQDASSPAAKRSRPLPTPLNQASAKQPEAGFAKELRVEVTRVLEHLDLASTNLGQVRALMESNLCLEPGKLDEHKDFIGGLIQDRIQQMQEVQEMQEDSEAKPEGTDYSTWTMEKLQEMLDILGEDSDGDRAALIERLTSMNATLSSAAPAPAPPQPAATKEMATPPKTVAPAKQQESETGMIWTYEVSGKKIGIREGPSVASNQQGDYLENGELFNVVERVRGGDEKRVYLKLADGRGWAYDRSAKDESKIVVEELGAKAV